MSKEQTPSKFKVWKDQKKAEIVAALLRNNFIHLYWFKSKDKKEFRTLAKEHIPKAVKSLVEGLGGAKNLLKIRSTINSLVIDYKSDYLIQREKLEEAGGIGLHLENHQLKILFNYLETKAIAKGIKTEMAKVKSSLTVMDID